MKTETAPESNRVERPEADSFNMKYLAYAYRYGIEIQGNPIKQSDKPHHGHDCLNTLKEIADIDFCQHITWI